MRPKGEALGRSRAPTRDFEPICGPARRRARYFASLLLALGLPAAHARAGACCAPDGGCTETTFAACVSPSVYLGESTTCVPDPCPGACCLQATGACSLLSQSDCMLGGRASWSGGACDPDPCERGACCIGAACSITGPKGCTGLFWTGVACTPSPCPGACCDTVSSACTPVSEIACTGAWSSGGCAPSPCPGACCNLETGDCTPGPHSACASPAQRWSPGPCTPGLCPRGVCCAIVTGLCRVTGPDGCIGPGETYAPGATCEPDNPCDLACCDNTTGACTLAGPAGCAGTATKSGACSPDPCLALIGACCTGADCTLALAAGCLRPGQAFTAPGTLCTPDNPCDVACCDNADGGCRLVASGRCGAGTLPGAGSCSPDPCLGLLGACCTGVDCAMALAAGCTAPGQVFLGPGIACMPANPCPAACCDPASGLCTVLPQSTCSGTLLALTSCAPNPCPPVARCRNVTLDASAECIALTIMASAVNNGSFSAPGGPAPCPLMVSLDFSGPFSSGNTTVVLTVKDCNGTSTCEAVVTVLGPDCNENGIPDLCECFWKNGDAASEPDGVLSHVGGAVPGGARAADDFYLPPCTVHRVCGFYARTITNSLPGLRKARVDFFEDCNGEPGGAPFATCLNGVILSEVPHPGRPGFDIVHWRFDLCSNPAALPNDGLWLDGGKPYWVSLVHLTDGQGTDESYWATPEAAELIGAVPRKSSGPHPGPPPITYAGVAWDPWGPIDDCCIECVNLDFSLVGESCPIHWDNGKPVTSSVAGGPSGSNPGVTQFRSADQFVIPNCEDPVLCLLEAWVWTNCVNPQFFLELYTDVCNRPGVLLPHDCAEDERDGPLCIADPIAMDTGITGILNGKLYKLYKVRREAIGRVILDPGTYWISAGAYSPSTLNSRSFFARRAAPCDACTAIKIAPARVRPGGAPVPTLELGGAGASGPPWTSLGYDLAFRVAVRPLLTYFVHGVDERRSSPAPCAADFNADGRAGVQDLFDFLDAYFTGCP